MMLITLQGNTFEFRHERARITAERALLKERYLSPSSLISSLRGPARFGTAERRCLLLEVVNRVIYFSNISYTAYVSKLLSR
jgi:hypothetical protein